MTIRARRALLAAAAVVMLLALGPFASPLVDHATAGVGGEAPVDHRNDVPVVQPVRSAAASPSSRTPSSRSLLVVALVVAFGLAGATFVRRRPDTSFVREGPPLWSRPPRRGPPFLLAG